MMSMWTCKRVILILMIQIFLILIQIFYFFCSFCRSVRSAGVVVGGVGVASPAPLREAGPPEMTHPQPPPAPLPPPLPPSPPLNQI